MRLTTAAITPASAPAFTTEAPLATTGAVEEEGAMEIPEEEEEEAEEEAADEVVAAAETALETTSGLVVTEAAEEVSVQLQSSKVRVVSSLTV